VYNHCIEKVNRPNFNYLGTVILCIEYDINNKLSELPCMCGTIYRTLGNEMRRKRVWVCTNQWHNQL